MLRLCFILKEELRYKTVTPSWDKDMSLGSVVDQFLDVDTCLPGHVDPRETMGSSKTNPKIMSVHPAAGQPRWRENLKYF